MSDTILITGGCGYLGSRLLIEALQSPEVQEIRILDNLQSGRREALMNLPRTQKICRFVEADILDEGALSMALDGVETVIHLAALVRTPMSFEHPAWLDQINHWGTQLLIEKCLSLGIPRFIFASSASVYGPGGPFDETSPCKPPAPYARSKLLAESSVRAASDRGMDTLILRFGSFFGRAPVTRFDSVANRFAYLAGIGRSLVIHGTGNQKRPLIDVEDAAGSILFALGNWSEVRNKVLNVSLSHFRILEVAKIVETICPGIPIRYTEQDFRDHFTFELDSKQIRNLGWEPRVELKDGLKRVIESFSGMNRFSPELDLEEES